LLHLQGVPTESFYKVPLRQALGSSADRVRLRYVANAGVLLSSGETDLLIDAPIRDGIPPYATSSADERDKLERALAPYDGVDAILVTHWHEDHFSADAVAAHLLRNRRAILISSPEVVERVRKVAPSIPEEQLRAVLPAPGASQLTRIGSLPVRVLRIAHNPTRRLPEQHVGFLVGDSSAVLHTGDANPTRENFALLRNLPAVDLALVPFWFMQTAANREFVADAVAPRRVVAMHLPPADAEGVRLAFASAAVRAILLIQPGTDVTLQP
jgi:L-ascorbate metabolism protein UlaG (beta-lactamase superfamily)